MQKSKEQKQWEDQQQINKLLDLLTHITNYTQGEDWKFQSKQVKMSMRKVGWKQ